MAGLGTRSLTLDIAGEPVTGEVSKAVVTSAAAEADFTTFEDAAAGGKRDYALDFIAVQDAETGSLWDRIWTAAGTSVAFTLRPYGNETPSVTQPHYTGNVTIVEPDGDFLGGEADASTSARFTVECSWPCAEKPVKVTTAG